MKSTLSAVLLSLVAVSVNAGDVALAIHGGAGTLSRETMTAEAEAQYRAALKASLLAGHKQLRAGAPALEAVTKAITVLEDSPLFNAGRGAVFTHDGAHELDASVMDGRTLNSGAVAGVTGIANPIMLAVEVLKHSPHVMLSGGGAEAFAKARGFEQKPAVYFRTEQRWQQLQKRLQEEARSARYSVDKFGTVGAVAIDKNGHLAAGTSTGGMTNKRYGRVGDSPIIAAGTYAEDGVCAVSSTGHGEYFIRAAVAYDICARVKYSKTRIDEAADATVNGRLKALGGSGGVIAMGRDGEVSMRFNTPGMYRGEIDHAGNIRIAIFREQNKKPNLK